MELSKEKSEEQAIVLKDIMRSVIMLDVEYLEMALTCMREACSFRESAMILNPSPLTALEKQDLDKAKIQQLKLLIDLAKNVNNIKNAEICLIGAEINASKMKNLF